MGPDVKGFTVFRRSAVPFMITNAQLRAARGLLGWSQARLAEGSGLGIATVKRMEGERGPLRSSAENVLKVQHALENAGVIFIDADEEGPGVRLKAEKPSL
jgi:transcriptional regulator with XRE-family HTH domain